MNMIKLPVFLLPLSLLTTAPIRAEPSAVTVDPALRERATTAIDHGLDWLIARQQPSGAWSDTNYPALTALPAWALIREDNALLQPVVDRAIAYILSCVHDTGIYKGAIFRAVAGQRGGGYINYNTAISIIPLHARGAPELAATILAAREFLARSQYLGHSLHHGGMGYDPATMRDYADLSNSYTAYEAMRLTQDIEEFRRSGTPVDLDWKAALAFIRHCHNDPAFNPLKWASDTPGEKGGFAYQPDRYRPDFGAYEGSDGVLKYRSAPGMTHAGLLSYLYAGLDRGDPRVQATVNWIAENWDPSRPNRNPELAGKPEAYGGMYFMSYVAARSLDLYGQDVLKPSAGAAFNWRDSLIRHLVERQSSEGFWVNEHGRYMESDPILVTAYAILALQSALGR